MAPSRRSRKRAPTIEDVAQRAGVSAATVSHVINKTRFVSDTTRQRVLGAMRDLDYQPNRLARSLRSKRTRTLGLLIPDSANPFFAEVLRGLEIASFELGYNVILCNSDDNPDKELEHANVLLERQVDGIVLVSAASDSVTEGMLVSKGVPFVLVDRLRPGRDIDTVIADNQQGGELATRHLLSLGHQCIACITGPSQATPSADRVAGYYTALNEAGLTPDESLVVGGDFRSHSGYDATMRLLAHPASISAIFACNDLMAIGALCAIHEANLRVPHDISVVGFDDMSLSSYTVPRLTTVSQPAQQMGKLAAEMLIERLRDTDTPVRHEVLPVSLVIRESSASPRNET